MNTDHLAAIHQRLCNEKARLALATTTRERAFRKRQIASAQKELDSEYEFLGMTPAADLDISDDDLLAALAA